MRTLTIFRKTVGDLAKPKLLVAYFVPFLTVTGFLALAMGSSTIEGAGAPLATQQADLHGAFAGASFFLVVGIPLLGLAAVFCALSVAKEAEAGTFQLLLSKPVRRWEYYVGTFGGVVLYGLFVAMASLLLTATMFVEFSGVHAAAISHGIFGQFAGSVAYALFAVTVVSGVAFALAVTTKDRLRTALGALAFPALYFAFLPVRLFAGAKYEDYVLYLVDVNYHFGNAFVFFQEVLGDLPVETQVSLAGWTGVYDTSSVDGDALPNSLETVGHVPMELSVLLLAAIGVGAFVLGFVRFRSMDV